MFTNKHIIISIYGFTLIFVGMFTQTTHSQSVEPVSDINTYIKIKEDQANPIFKKLASYNMNEYPFDKMEKLVGFSDLLAISDKIVLLYESSVKNKKILESMIQDAQIAFLNRNTRYPYAVQNYYALSDALPNLDVDLLFATFVICNKEKMIKNIDVLLEYSPIFIGPEEIAEPILAPSVRKNGNISIEQRLKQWPAANAILSNPEKSIPLLIQVVKNTKIEEHIRLRASAFLNQLSPDSIKGILPSIEEEIAKQITCIQENNLSWKYAIPNTCERIKHGKDKIGRLLKKSQNK